MYSMVFERNREYLQLLSTNLHSSTRAAQDFDAPSSLFPPSFFRLSSSCDPPRFLNKLRLVFLCPSGTVREVMSVPRFAALQNRLHGRPSLTVFLARWSECASDRDARDATGGARQRVKPRPEYVPMQRFDRANFFSQALQFVHSSAGPPTVSSGFNHPLFHIFESLQVGRVLEAAARS